MNGDPSFTDAANEFSHSTRATNDHWRSDPQALSAFLQSAVLTNHTAFTSVDKHSSCECCCGCQPFIPFQIALSCRRICCRFRLQSFSNTRC